MHTHIHYNTQSWGTCYKGSTLYNIIIYFLGIVGDCSALLVLSKVIYYVTVRRKSNEY